MKTKTPPRPAPRRRPPTRRRPARRPALSAPPGVAALWHALTRRWLTILVLGGGLGVLGAAVGWFVVPAKYTGVGDPAPRPAPAARRLREHRGLRQLPRQQATQVKSDPVLEAALKKPEAAELPEVRAQGKDALAWLQGRPSSWTTRRPAPRRCGSSVTADRADDAAVLANQWAQAAGEVYTAEEEAKIKERDQAAAARAIATMTELLRKKKNELQARRDLLGLEDPKVIDAKLQAEQAAQTACRASASQVELELKRLERAARRPQGGAGSPRKGGSRALRRGRGDRQGLPAEPGGPGAGRSAADVAEEDGRAAWPCCGRRTATPTRAW